MLQIITGKFFITDELHVTRHHAVFHTNYAPAHRSAQENETPDGGLRLFPGRYETPAGTLVSSSVSKPPGGVFPWIYEVDEKLEAVRPDGSKEFLIGVGADYFIQDFAAVASFALNITCTSDFDLTRRLIHAPQSALGVPHPPQKYIGRVFDPRIEPQEGDAAQLQEFVSDMVGLKRNTFKAAMRAVRRYVNGLHRIADDVDLAYALLVASIESLAQDFDAFAPTWADYDQNKRELLDRVLGGADPAVAEGVRRVLLEQEHLALGKRYRAFALEHLQPSFFREEAANQPSPARRCELPSALERAYKLRSSYVHSLRELPRIMTVSPDAGDMMEIGNQPHLTLHGLARVARHVIREFVARAPKVEREEFNYRQDLPNVVQVPLSFQIWGTWSGNYNHTSARRFLSGFLQEELPKLMTAEPNSKVTLTDIRPIMEKIEAQVPGLSKAEQRRPLLLLYILFHRLTASEDHRPNFEQFINKHESDFEAPSVEGMVGHVLFGNETGWTPEEFEEMLRSYYAQRHHKNGLNIGNLWEAAVTLSCADMYRHVGNEDHARVLVSQAVENLPGNAQLLEFERGMNQTPLPEINWMPLLLPQPQPPSNDEADDASSQPSESTTDVENSTNDQNPPVQIIVPDDSEPDTN